jgi:membrane-associated protease RseP (regulator of RpoE activity)
LRTTRLRRPAAIILPFMAAAVICLMWMSITGADEEKTGWLGVSLQRLTPNLREAMDITSDAGVLITEVVEDSPAEKAGIQEGDAILQYNGTAVTSPSRLMKLVRQTGPDTKVTIVVSRKGKEKTLIAQIGEREAEDYRFRIYKGDDGEDLLMNFDENAFSLGLTGLPGILMGPGLWLGIKPIGLTDQLAGYFKVKDGHGVLVSEVVKDSPAEKAGFQAGDVIVKLGDESIEDTMELMEAIGDHEEGDEVTVVVIRDGKEKTLRAALEESPDKEKLSIMKKLDNCPGGMKKFCLKGPSEDLVDIYLDKETAGDELKTLQDHMEKLEEELQRIKENLEMK